MPAMLRLTLLTLLTCASTVALAEPLELDPGFTPHPLVVTNITAKSEVYATDLGITDCGSSHTSKAPAFEFELTKPFPELFLRFEEPKGGGKLVGTSVAIFFPSGGYICLDNNEAFRTNWPKGRYKVFMISYSTGTATAIRFEIPSRSKADVAASKDQAPEITFDSAAPVHPARFELAARAVAENQDVVLPCLKKTDGVMPLARVNVPRAYAQLVIQTPRATAPLFLVDADNKRCIDDGPLAAGSYVLWAKVPRDNPPKSVTLEIEDKAEPLRFGAPVNEVALGDLKTPQLLMGNVRAKEPRPERDNRCEDGTALAPDFHIVAKEPHQDVRITLLTTVGKQWLRIYGPLEKVTANSRTQCVSDRTHDIKIMEGTYAVWVGGAADHAFTVALSDSDTELDRHYLPNQPAADLTVPQRQLSLHFPYFSEAPGTRESVLVADATWLFAEAPEALFVYPRIDVKASGSALALQKGEPLLVLSASYFLRANGERTSAPPELIGVTRDAPGFPAPVVLEQPERIDSAIDDAGPEDQAAVDAYRTLTDKVGGCIGDYLAAHDPTWGKDHEVYRISGNSVVNVSDQVYKAAKARCGWNKVEAAEAKLAKTLDASRKVRWQKLYAAAKARFAK